MIARKVRNSGPRPQSANPPHDARAQLVAVLQHGPALPHDMRGHCADTERHEATIDKQNKGLIYVPHRTNYQDMDDQTADSADSANLDTPLPEAGGGLRSQDAAHPCGADPSATKIKKSRKGIPNRITAEIKEMIMSRGRPVQFLCDVARGKKIRVGPQAGPGEAKYEYPDLATRMAAAKILMPKLVADLKAIEITGDSENPLSIDDGREPMSTLELARRIAYQLDLASREPDARRPAEAPRAGATAQADGSCLSPSAAPAPDPSEPEEPQQPTPGGFDPSIPGTHSEALGWVEGGPVSSGSGEANGAAPEPPREPIPGETADIGSYTVVCFEGGREGLPPQFEIRGSRDERLCTNPGGGWSGVLKWIERKSPPGADLTVTIRKTRPIGGGSRPDERVLRVVSAPVVHGGYENRKR